MFADVGLLALRLALGAVFLAHAAQKGFGAFGGPGFEGATGFIGSLGFRPAPRSGQGRSRWTICWGSRGNVSDFIDSPVAFTGGGISPRRLPTSSPPPGRTPPGPAPLPRP